MAYPVPSFVQTRNTILQEIRNRTGITAPEDSDAAIRADGTASVIDGLYSHQLYIQRQLFVATADEPYLYIHAEAAGIPRLGGTYASGTVQAISNASSTIAQGTKLSDGKGHYWSVIEAVNLSANIASVVSVTADNTGSAWNFNGQNLNWVSPPANVKSTVDNVSIAGGSEQEALEAWRARILVAKGLGRARGRAADLEVLMHTVAGVKDVYIYPKRRGLGSLDIAITALGSPATLPSAALLAAAQAVLDADAGFWADCRVFAPTAQLLNITANVSGSSNLNAVKQVISDYINDLAPAKPYLPAVLISRILALDSVTDVQLSPNTNVTPLVDWQHVKWLRAGIITVNQA